MKKVFLCISLLTAPLALANSALENLVEQAQFWDQRHRPDRAFGAWERVLSVDSENPQALSRLSILSQELDKAQQSEAYLQRLLSSDATPQLLRRTQETLRMRSQLDDNALQSARTAASAGNTADALAHYKTAFGGDTPLSSELALEYYQVMSGDRQRWKAARDGLKSLAKEYPQRRDVAYAYGRVLTYSEVTRRDGIARLLSLAESGDASRQMRSDLAQAFAWLDVKASDHALIQRYTKTIGPAPELETRLAAAIAGPEDAPLSARDVAIRDGFQALDNNNLKSARESFQLALSEDPKSANALAGLGLIQLREEHFASAQNSFAKAVKLRPSLAKTYRAAITAADFWADLHRANVYYDSGKLSEAEKTYRSALKTPPDLPAAGVARRGLIAALRAQSKSDEAEKLIRQALRDDPSDIDLGIYLIEILVERGDMHGAQQLMADLGQNDSALLRNLRARIAKHQAELALQQGLTRDAEAYLNQALIADPTDPWVRLELARVLQAQGHTQKAGSMLNTIMTAAVDNSQGWLAQAYAFGESQRWHDALMALENVDRHNRDAGARALQRRAWVNYQLERLDQLVQRKDMINARKLMATISNAANNDPDFAPSLATGWTRMGDPARAVGILRSVLSQSAAPLSNGSQVQYASLLLQLDQDAEFEAVTLDLIRRPELDAQDRGNLEDLIVGYRIKLADRAREAGEFDHAYNELRDVLKRYPNQPRVQMALARLFASSGDGAGAVSIMQGLIEGQKKVSDDVLREAINTALTARNERLAETWLKQAEARPSLKTAALDFRGRLADLRGQRGKALDYYQQAQRASRNEQFASGYPVLTMIDPNQPDSTQPGRTPNLSDQPIGPLLPRATERRVSAPQESDQHKVAAEPALDKVLADENLVASGQHIQSDQPFSWRASSAQPAAESATIRALNARIAGWWNGGIATRNRVGEAGLSEILEIRAPLQWVSREYASGQFGLGAQPISLNAGRVSGANALNRFGTIAAFAADPGDTDVSASGVALTAAYRNGDVRLDIGTTPLGFEQENLTAGLRWSPQTERMRYVFDISRRAVTDSVLSYAGIEDPVTGKTWGGIMASGGQVDMAYDMDRYGIYFNGGFHTLSGHNVVDNARLGLGAGMFFRVKRTAAQEFTVGLNVTTLSYDENLRFFTFGHGGYFSPQFFGALTVPVRLSGEYRNVSYQLDAAIGLQSFQEDGNALYPERPQLQSAVELEVAQRPNDNDLVAGYGDKDESGLAYRLGLTGRYRVNDQLDLLGRISADNAQDYAEYNVGAYVRWYTSPYERSSLVIDLPYANGVALP